MSRSLVSRLILSCLVVSLSSLSHAQSPAKISASQLADQRDVIVILRDQMPGITPAHGSRQARAASLAQAQAPLIASLQQVRTRNVRSFRSINAFATSVSAAEAEKLASDPQVQAVVADAVIKMPHPLRNQFDGMPAIAGSKSDASTSDDGLCNTLEPEALQLTHAAFLDPAKPQAQQLLDGNGLTVTGRGVKVAFIADGLDTASPGFVRPDGSSVFVDYQDFSGDPAGTPTAGGEGFGDASSIAAQDMPNGKPLTFDISQFVNPAHPLPSPCNIRIRGMAPGASLVGLKVFGESGTTNSAVVQAIEWAVVEDDVDVINESFGNNPYFDRQNDPITMANTMAVRAGITVVVSTGDGGSAGTISSPATDYDVIAAGASTQFRLYAQTSQAANPFANGYLSGNISSLSAGGFAQLTPRTVDVVAPGDLGWALCSSNVALYEDCTNYQGAGSPIEVFGGTSEAAPLTAGEAALVIQAYRSTHHDSSPSPALVKQIIMSTASDLGAPSDEQGAGLIDAEAAVHTALSLGEAAHQGNGLLFDKTSAEVVDTPNRSQTLVFTVKNTGSTPRRLTPHLQMLGEPSAGATLTLQLAPASDPTFPNVTGIPRPYITQTFTVAAGAQHLDAAIAYQPSTSNSPVVFLALLEPSGRQAAYSLPQGVDNGYSHVDVASPKAGTWTAVLWTHPPADATSYSGPVKFSWSTERFVNFGSVSPSLLDLASGASGVITATFETPSEPGDRALALRFAAGSEGPTIADPEIPITLRTLVPIDAAGGNFTGIVTGGNGRSGTGPYQTYEFDVPPGAKDLSLALHVRDSGYLLQGVLVDPHGMDLSVQGNLDPLASSVAPLNAMQLYHEYPQPGRWHFVLLLNYTSSGNQTSLPFTAKIRLNTVPASDLPNDPGIRLSASGAPLTIPILVTNTSSITQLFFADARLRTRQLTTLPIFICSRTTTLPGLCLYTYVPPEANEIQFLAQSTLPINMDVFTANGYGVGGTGSPDLYAHPIAPGAVQASLRVPEVPWGFWQMAPSLLGPYGPAGTPTAPLTASASVMMRPFDPGVTTDSGNAYSDALVGTATFNPLVLAPGASGTIHVTITPDPSRVGQIIEGYVFLDNFNVYIGLGDEVGRIPYAYTVAP